MAEKKLPLNVIFDTLVMNHKLSSQENTIFTTNDHKLFFATSPLYSGDPFNYSSCFYSMFTSHKADAIKFGGRSNIFE